MCLVSARRYLGRIVNARGFRDTVLLEIKKLSSNVEHRAANAVFLGYTRPPPVYV